MEEIYLDNSATTRVDPAVAEVILQAHTNLYGNPSSLHRKGVEGEKIVGSARRQLAALLGAEPAEILFTSGGTEANNLAIKGVARHHRRRGNHLVTSMAEHPSVLKSFKNLEEEGFQVTYLPVDSQARISLEALKEALTPGTILVSLGYVNSEVGTILPIDQAARIIKENSPKALFHVDAVQALGKIPLKPGAWGVDLLSVSAHKIHGPKGTGALYIKKGTLLKPLFHGGDQEQGLRPGTENVPGIAGFGKAGELAYRNFEKNHRLLYDLKYFFWEQVQARVPRVLINGPAAAKGAPHIINLAFPGTVAEVLLHLLEEKGIYVSTGSACHSRRREASHVLKAMALGEDRLFSSLRFSFSPQNTREQIAYTARILGEAVQRLCRLRGGSA